MNYKEQRLKNINDKFNVRDELQHLSVDGIMEHQPKNDFAVCIMNILADGNCGNIIRSSVLFGADKVFIGGRRRFDRRSCVGSQNYIDVENLDGFDSESQNINYIEVIEKIKSQGYYIVCCETDGIDLRNFKVETTKCLRYQNTKPCFIFGNEGFGLPQQILESADFTISIPQHGVLRSFNVSVAAGIIMYEYVRDLS